MSRGRKDRNPAQLAIERQIISIAIQTFNQNEYTTGTIIHDGFLVESLDVKDEVLRKAEQAVKLMKGYDIKLEKKSLKDFNEECLWGTTGDDDGEEELQSESDTDIARHFMAFMEEKGHAFTRSEGEVFWFNPDHGIYLTGLRQLRVYMNDCPRLPADRRGKTEEQNKWVKQIESIVNDDPEFRNKVVHTTYRKIAFKNGYYDCDKKLCATTTSHGIPQIINRFRVHGWRRATVSARQGIFLPPTSSTTSRAPRSRSSPFPRLAPHPTPSDQSRPR